MMTTMSKKHGALWKFNGVDLNKFAYLLCVAYLQFSALPSLAQGTATISAERPGFSSSPIALAPSVLQIESGYQFTRDSGVVDFDGYTLPLVLFRVGLIERLELQLSWAGYSSSDIGNQNIHGVNDASVGVKWQVNGPDAAVPLAFFAGLSLPVGTDDFSSDTVDPSLGAFWSYNSGLDWFGTVLISESDNDVSIGNAIGISLPIEAETSAYVEYFGNYGSDSGSEHYLNGGFAYLARTDLQFDLHGGVGLNGRAADFFVGFGTAYRF